MFVSQAHSFQQQARLAVTLAWIAGFTNTVALIACGHAVSHTSGTTANLGHDVFAAQWPIAAYGLFLLVAFFLGAAVSAFLTEFGRRRAWESIYVLPMAAEALLLALFAVGLELSTRVDGGLTLWWMTGVASAAMGLQNATITRISSGVVRTTHVTGVVTDLGLEAVQFLWWLRDRRRNVPPAPARGLLYSVYHHPTARRLALLLAILFTFALGAGLATVASAQFPRFAMFPPVGFLLWVVYQDLTAPIAEIRASDLLRPADLPPEISIFHLRHRDARKGKIHRMPNLLAWSQRLPRSTRVVILDIGEITGLDANAAMELRAVLAELAGQGRTMVIAGLTVHQFEQLRLAGAGDLLESENICPDLEIAIARGLNLLTPDPDPRPPVALPAA